jgi:hypothetical protein
VGVTNINKTGFGVQVIPNPNDGAFTIAGSIGAGAEEIVSIRITDVIGHEVFLSAKQVYNGLLNEKILLDNSVANGVYLISITSDKNHEVIRMLLER